MNKEIIVEELIKELKELHHQSEKCANESNHINNIRSYKILIVEASIKYYRTLLEIENDRRSYMENYFEYKGD
jgi:hypothetical protein